MSGRWPARSKLSSSAPAFESSFDDRSIESKWKASASKIGSAAVPCAVSWLFFSFSTIESVWPRKESRSTPAFGSLLRPGRSFDSEADLSLNRVINSYFGLTCDARLP